MMVGRAVCDAPYRWKNVDSRLYNAPDPGLTRRTILEKYAKYAAEEESVEGPRVRPSLIKPLFNLFHSEYNGKLFRRELNDKLIATKRGAPLAVCDLIMDSIQCLPDEILDDTKRPANEEEEKEEEMMTSLKNNRKIYF